MSFEVEGYGNGLKTTDIIQCSFLPLITETHVGVTIAFTFQPQISGLTVHKGHIHSTLD